MALNLPYYPNRIKKHHYIDTSLYDKIFCSVIFDNNISFIHGDNIDFGGTGSYDVSKKLPDEIEQLTPDYSIYPFNDISYGFISRGCIRNCSFCKVPTKEGHIHQVSTVDKIIQHKLVKFMDNNILALPNHKEILQELVNKRIHCQFNQGLDIRLLDLENSSLLSKLKYYREYIFAFDNWKYKDIIEEKLPLLSWRKDWQIKFFCYIHPSMPISDTINRIKWMREHKCLPYIMRDISCWDSSLSNFYTDLASYCNQVAFFKGTTFETYLIKRYPYNRNRIKSSVNLYNSIPNGLGVGKEV